MGAIRISFLLPSKDRLDLLKCAISSIHALNDDDVEIVVSDNASREDYRSYVEGLHDPRIVYRRLPEPVSVTENWQSALEMATGDYFLMLGDDDAVAPGFNSIVRPFLSADGPDAVYLAAYHYGYPGVLDFRPSGYLARVRNAEFLIHNTAPFCLTTAYVRDLAASVLDFRYRFAFNAQHFLLRRTFVAQFDAAGGLYQSPYPDTFAAVVILSHVASALVIPEESVIIGISPKSFGAYYFGNRHDEGYAFLANAEVDMPLREALRGTILPGDANNTNWLIAAEASQRLVGSVLRKPVNIVRYRALQIVSVLRDRYLHGRCADDQVDDMKKRLSAEELSLVELLEAAIGVAAQANRALLVDMFAAVDRKLGQFITADISFLDIGPHDTIADALAWLKSPPPNAFREGMHDGQNGAQVDERAPGVAEQDGPREQSTAAAGRRAQPDGPGSWFLKKGLGASSYGLANRVLRRIRGIMGAGPETPA